MGLNKIKDVSLGNSLSGKIAGVTILSSTGSAGVTGDPRIIIRGNRSIHGKVLSQWTSILNQEV